MSNQFDIQYNNITSNQAPGLTEYEKSVFLTKAQEEYVLALYNGRNGIGESFESSEELRRCLSSLIKEATLVPMTSGVPTGMSSSSKFFKLPSSPKVWFITYEALTISNEGECNDGATMEVIPATQDEYHRIRKNPFRGPNGRRALRLDLYNDIVEIICKYGISSYYIRYIKELNPIILEDLSDDLSIKGETEAAQCELDETLHQAIVDRAVALAVQARDI